MLTVEEVYFAGITAGLKSAETKIKDAIEELNDNISFYGSLHGEEYKLSGMRESLKMVQDIIKIHA